MIGPILQPRSLSDAYRSRLSLLWLPAYYRSVILRVRRPMHLWPQSRCAELGWTPQMVGNPYGHSPIAGNCLRQVDAVFLRRRFSAVLLSAVRHLSPRYEVASARDDLRASRLQRDHSWTPACSTLEVGSEAAPWVYWAAQPYRPRDGADAAVAHPCDGAGHCALPATQALSVAIRIL